jgi:hypothetical protein
MRIEWAFRSNCRLAMALASFLIEEAACGARPAAATSTFRVTPLASKRLI